MRSLKTMPLKSIQVSLMDKEKWLRCFRNNEPLIVINNNESCNIENITVSFNIFPHVPFVNSKPFDKNISLTFKHMRLPENGLITETPTEKEIVLLDQLKEFHKLILQSRVEPTVRILALYSGFCTLWEKSNTSDLAQMELQEKELLIQLVKAGCHIKIIVSLDIQKAISCGFTKEEIYIRTADLCSVCDSLSSYDNFEIVVATSPFTYEPQLILDGVLINQQLNFCGRENYSYSRWDSNQGKIIQACRGFAYFFECMYQGNAALMEALNFQKISDVIFFWIRKKLAEI